MEALRDLALEQLKRVDLLPAVSHGLGLVEVSYGAGGRAGEGDGGLVALVKLGVGGGLGLRVLLAGLAELLLHLDLHFAELGLLIFHERRGVVGDVAGVGQKPLLFLSQLDPCELQPGLEGDLEVHDEEEGVDAVLLLDDALEDVLFRDGLAALLDAQRHQVDAVLGPQLEDLHLLVDLHVPVLAPHAAVEQLVEVDVAVVTLDRHLEQLLLELSVLVVLLVEAQTGLLVPEVAQSSEELGELVLLDLEAVVAVLSELLPNLHEGLLVVLEKSDHVLLGQVVLFELLDDDQDEQVEHHVRADQHEDHEVEVGPGGAARLVGDAVVHLRAPHIKHDLVPVLARRESEEEQEGVEEVAEVLPFVDHVAHDHLLEQVVAEDREHEEDQHQKHEHVHQRGD
mmetsp:Transcript_7183/g.12110  ORF Transcript_7183/g.12110 Transcript_7183/m.12110 type:complete len:397 (+) Transcript_7183:210-1400(+)